MRIVQLANMYHARSGGLRTVVDTLGRGYAAAELRLGVNARDIGHFKHGNRRHLQRFERIIALRARLILRANAKRKRANEKNNSYARRNSVHHNSELIR